MLISGTMEISAQSALQKVILDLLSRPIAFHCVIPDNTTLLTYTNAYHFSLLKMQRRGLSPSDRECVHSRFITGCMDEACLGLCSDHSIPNCYLEHFRNFDTNKSELLNQASDFRSKDYFKILMVKWQMLDDALQLGSGNVSAVFFFDADVLLLQNPFMHFDYMKYDFRYQAEFAVDDCTAGVNGGQLYVRNTDAGRQFLRNMMSQSQAILGAGQYGRLDQAYAVEAMRKAGATACALDKKKFIGSSCPHAAACAHNVTSPLAGAVTFHAHGITDEKHKLARLADFLFAWETLANISKHFTYINTTWNNRPTTINNKQINTTECLRLAPL
jgi:hypothetical protein